MDGLFASNNYNLDLPNCVKATVKISGDRIIFCDTRTEYIRVKKSGTRKGAKGYTIKQQKIPIIHGQIIIPQSEKFNVFGIAGDHGCGATLYQIKKYKNRQILRINDLPTGGGRWLNGEAQKQLQFQHKKWIKQQPMEIRGILHKYSDPYKLGTLGSGNHFVHLVGTADNLKMVIHSGSRGLWSKLVESGELPKEYSDKTAKLLRATEQYAELNRDLMATFIATGTLKSHMPKKIVNETHTRLSEEYGIPLIQKNVIVNSYERKHMILGNSESGVGFHKEHKNPYIVHGTGPLWGTKGRFISINHLHEKFDENGKRLPNKNILKHIYNFEKHRTKDGLYLI